MDDKGNGCLVQRNTVTDPQGDDQDAFQTHALYPGDGTNNTFTRNVVRGRWPGFGIGLYPPAANVVRCDNTAPGAA
ncbi:hypothetical protein [uncultured Jatrophihabitans sp.]|uniref:hypothetical protein n=1 Tax=uncultured Jatrophihabitans sp. TaxID=1610747 RepID=UPI0035CC2234